MPVTPKFFSAMLDQHQQFIENWTKAVIQAAAKVPNVDPEIRNEWRRQLEAANATLKAQKKTMEQIAEQIAARLGPELTALQSAVEKGAPQVEALMKEWAPQLHAMQELAEKMMKLKGEQ